MPSIVVVGHGAAVQARTTRYERFDDVSVAGVVNTGATLSTPFDFPQYETATDALLGADVDGVDICGPGFTHPDVLDTVLNEEVPVRCDPPFALTDTRFDHVVSQASGENGWVMAYSPHRFSRLYGQLQSAAETGDIGDIGVARIKRTAPFDGGSWNISYSGVTIVEEYVDALCSVLAHDIDVLEWTFGPIGRVFARAREGDRCDHLHAISAFREGGRATVEITWCDESTQSSYVDVEYSGSHGRLDFDDGDVSALHEDGNSLNVDPPEDECRGRTLRKFVDYLQGIEEPPIGAVPTPPSRVATAVRQSAEKGGPIKLGKTSP